MHPYTRACSSVPRRCLCAHTLSAAVTGLMLLRDVIRQRAWPRGDGVPILMQQHLQVSRHAECFSPCLCSRTHLRHTKQSATTHAYAAALTSGTPSKALQPLPPMQQHSLASHQAKRYNPCLCSSTHQRHTKQSATTPAAHAAALTSGTPRAYTATPTSTTPRDTALQNPCPCSSTHQRHPMHCATAGEAHAAPFHPCLCTSCWGGLDTRGCFLRHGLALVQGRPTHGATVGEFFAAPFEPR